MADGMDILDDLFHSCALQAYLEEAIQCGDHPNPQSTKYRAYRLYEGELANKNAQKKVGSHVSNQVVTCESQQSEPLSTAIVGGSTTLFCLVLFDPVIGGL